MQTWSRDGLVQKGRVAVHGEDHEMRTSWEKTAEAGSVRWLAPLHLATGDKLSRFRSSCHELQAPSWQASLALLNKALLVAVTNREPLQKHHSETVATLLSQRARQAACRSAFRLYPCVTQGQVSLC